MWIWELLVLIVGDGFRRYAILILNLLWFWPGPFTRLRNTHAFCGSYVFDFLNNFEFMSQRNAHLLDVLILELEGCLLIFHAIVDEFVKILFELDWGKETADFAVLVILLLECVLQVALDSASRASWWLEISRKGCGLLGRHSALLRFLGHLTAGSLAPRFCYHSSRGQVLLILLMMTYDSVRIATDFPLSCSSAPHRSFFALLNLTPFIFF